MNDLGETVVVAAGGTNPIAGQGRRQDRADLRRHLFHPPDQRPADDQRDRLQGEGARTPSGSPARSSASSRRSRRTCRAISSSRRVDDESEEIRKNLNDLYSPGRDHHRHRLRHDLRRPAAVQAVAPHPVLDRLLRRHHLQPHLRLQDLAEHADPGRPGPGLRHVRRQLHRRLREHPPPAGEGAVLRGRRPSRGPRRSSSPSWPRL